jgi:hypothetical protein
MSEITTTVIGDLPEVTVASPTDNLVIDDGVTTSKISVMNLIQVPIGFRSGLDIVRKNNSTITLTGGMIEINGLGYILDVLTDKIPGSMTASSWYYIFVNAPDSGLVLSNTQVSVSITPPTYDHGKCGWYDATGLKRCIGFLFSDVSSNVWPFAQIGKLYCLPNTIQFLSTSAPATTWTPINTNVPIIGSVLCDVKGISVSNGAGSGRTGYMQGYDGTNSDTIVITGLGIANGAGAETYFPYLGASRKLLTTPTGYIYYYVDAGYSCTSYKLFIEGFALPGGF